MVGDRLTPDVRDEPAGSSESASETADVVSRPRPPGDYGVFWLDLHGRVTRWSDEAQKIFGHTGDEASTLRLHDLFTEMDQAAGAPERALAAARDQGTWDGIGWRVTRSGESFWATTSLTTVHTPNGLDIGVMAVVRRLESTLTSDVIGSDTQRLASLGRVASEVSHDVRNILSAIRGFAVVLERRLPDGDVAHQVWHELVKACDRGADLTERVLGVARSEASTEAPVSLAETVRTLAPMLRQIVPPRIRLEIEAQGDVTPIVARRHDIELAILNLVVNARDAISGPGKIAITLAEERGGRSGDPRVVLVVSDTGKGMSPDIQQRIFDRFFTTKDSGRGTGLGMSMVRDSVRAAGGSIEIESAQGSGTVVRMAFDPETKIEGVDTPGGPAESAIGADGGVRAPAGDGRKRARHTVLVWCGSPVLRAAAAELLGRRGYGVRVATDQKMAERLLEDPAAPVDCVIVDASSEVPQNSDQAGRERRSAPPVIGLVDGAGGGSHDDGSGELSPIGTADRVLSMPLDPGLLCEAVLELASEYQERRASIH